MTDLLTAEIAGRCLVDVRGFEPLTPCLQSWEGKTLKALPGVANTENNEISALSVVPKLSRAFRY